jgi:hypothetical protein
MLKYAKQMGKSLLTSLKRHEEIRFRIRLLQSVQNIERHHCRQLQRHISSGCSAGGYIPAIAGQSELIIYNFFSVNYGLRGKISLVIGRIDTTGRIKSALCKTLDYRNSIWSSNNTESIALGANEGVIYVLAINPRIPSNHGSNFGHLRFWGLWDNSCIVHSMPRNSISFLSPRSKHLYDRMMYSKLAFKAIYNSGREVLRLDRRGDLSGSIKVKGLGYNIQVNESGCATSVHHSSPLTRIERFKRFDRRDTKNVIYYQNIVAVPPLEGLDVEMYFGELCKPGSLYRCHVEAVNHENRVHILCSREFVAKDSTSVRYSDLFNSFKTKEHTWVRFEPVDGMISDHYINATYISHQVNSPFDSIHSHNFSCAEPNTTRSLKFAPFLQTILVDSLQERHFKSILAIWGAYNTTARVRIRVFCVDEPALEYVCYIEIPANSLRYVLCAHIIEKLLAEDLFNADHSVVYSKQHGKFIIQLESEEFNLNANIYIASLDSDGHLRALACDHLTGG